MTDRPYSDPEKPGRKDTTGLEWWACDPYPTWYRWEGTTLHTARYGHKWADGFNDYMKKVIGL